MTPPRNRNGSAKTLAEWLSFALNHPDKLKLDGSPARCMAISVMHLSHNIEKEIHGCKLGSKVFDDAGVAAFADTLRGICKTDAQNLSGSQQYIVYAFYEEASEPGCRYVLRESGHVMATYGGIATEPATAEGALMQSMRQTEGLSQAYMASIGNVMNVQNTIMRELGGRLTETLRENRDMFDFVKQVTLEMTLNQREHEMKVLDHTRNTQLMTKALQFAPAMLNTITGKEVVPQNTADTMILEGFAEALDEEALMHIAPLMTKIPAAAQGVLMSRLGQIQAQKQEKEAQIKAQLDQVNKKKATLAELSDRDPSE